MPMYDVMYEITGYGWATFEAEDEEEARDIAVEYFTTSDMDIDDIVIGTLKELPEVEAETRR